MFLPMNTIEADHITPRSNLGSDKFSNLQALSHSKESPRFGCIYGSAFRSWVLGREPDEGKLSCPDRKTGVWS